MRSRSAIVLVVMSLALSGVPAFAVPAKKPTRIEECRSRSVAIPIPREKAQQALPPGFQSGFGAASQDDVPYVYFESFTCGDAAAPKLAIASSYLWVVPPRRYQSGGPGARFILSAVIGGTEARRIENAACVTDVFSYGDITQVDHVETVDAAATETNVVSDVLSASWTTTTGTWLTDGARSTRWFYGTDKGVGFFDLIEVIDLLRMGSGAIRFDKPFFELPPAAGGPSLAVEGEVIVPNRKCSEI